MKLKLPDRAQVVNVLSNIVVVVTWLCFIAMLALPFYVLIHFIIKFW